MRKAKIVNHIQDIEEIVDLCMVEGNGIYAVPGYETPVSVMEVTPFGREELSRKYPDMEFIDALDGKTYSVMKTGEFVQ